ncbi:hypothetical protein PGTUg99_017657 [Puccinia graminis f. sp. tritici]|uniref:Uncharacterized protein n=1 Tax=Puccinia graminis f. sp. tritici TaxID=56615 RepID=A0A5B0N0Y7_PUCGR|nr:hypothetical protein PGTUg99_017657 [Puccinia graminis f. sp. tritici]
MGRVTGKLEDDLSRLNDVLGTNLAFQSVTVGRGGGSSRVGYDQRFQESKGFTAESVKTFNRRQPESINLDQGCLKSTSCEGVLGRKLFLIQLDKCSTNVRRNRPKEPLVSGVVQAVAERISF